jgi:hypothetical protein
MNLSEKSKKQIGVIMGYNTPKIRIKKLCQIFFKKIYKQIQEAFNYINGLQHIEPQITFIKNNNEIIKPNNFGTNDFPREIIERINTHSIQQYLFVFSLNHRQFNIFFVLEEKKSKKKLQEYLKQIQVWLYILSYISPTTCANYLNIYLYLTHLKKIVPTDGSYLRETNVNSAFTTSCNPKSSTSEIIIFRQEEWFKVFIHETLHVFGMDFSSMDCTKINNFLKKSFPLLINSPINAFEAYTEFWANIINVCFCSFTLTKTEQSFLVTTAQMINMEINFSVFQMIKVLDYNGLTHDELAQPQKQYREQTSVFSYYVIKTILLVHFQEFIGWCILHNGVKNPILFRKTNKNMVDFCAFVLEHYNLDFCKFVAMNNVVKVQGLGSSLNDKTMRMTICELG